MEVDTHRKRVEEAIAILNNRQADLQTNEYLHGYYSPETYRADVGAKMAWGRLALEAMRALPHIPRLIKKRRMEQTNV